MTAEVVSGGGMGLWEGGSECGVGISEVVWCRVLIISRIPEVHPPSLLLPMSV